MTQAEIYQAVSPKLPKNFPFYDWVPKPLGIAFLVILFIPIMTVSGAYTVNSSEWWEDLASNRNTSPSSVS